MHEIMPISQMGHDKLKEELSELEKEAIQVRQRVAEAREQGDLKENGEYIYGRQQLGFIEGRLAEIRGRLNYSRIVDCTQVPCDRADFGTVVTLRNLENQKTIVFHLLGPYDADIADDGISIRSPVGEALVGLAPGQQVEVNAPRGLIRYELLDVKKSDFS